MSQHNPKHANFANMTVPSPKVPVWKYGYAPYGKQAEQVVVYSPQKTIGSNTRRIILKQANGLDTNKVWINLNIYDYQRCDPDNEEELFDNAHGVIVRHGTARGIQAEGNYALFQYKPGERVWVESRVKPGPESDLRDSIPIINLDTLERYDIPYRHVCFVPEIVSSNDSDDNLASIVSHTFSYNPTNSLASQPLYQLYVVWHADDPSCARLEWDTWQRNCRNSKTGPRMLKGFRRMRPKEQLDAFGHEWHSLRRSLEVSRWAEDASSLLASNSIVSGRNNTASHSPTLGHDDEARSAYSTPSTHTLEEVTTIAPEPVQYGPKLSTDDISSGSPP
ncbi:hypothetical protein S40288_10799 [Stachybotrys chartarum IBT 40288]|nr:hypothetical protein S40288_10799 [Stachybotrys chartarum IBT 40288]